MKGIMQYLINKLMVILYANYVYLPKYYCGLNILKKWVCRKKGYVI